MFIIIFILSFLQLHAVNLSKDTLYKKVLDNEKASKLYYKNLEGFLSNSLYIPDKKSSYDEKKGITVKGTYSVKEVEYLLSKLHDILFETLYTCNPKAERADTFSQAAMGGGAYTPDSQHYAAFMNSALSLKKIDTDFFKTPTHYGIHYKDKKTGKELFWCVLTPTAPAPAPECVAQYVQMYNRYKNPKINGNMNITEDELEFLSSEDFIALTSEAVDVEDFDETQKNENISLQNKPVEVSVASPVEIKPLPAPEPIRPVLGIASINRQETSTDLTDLQGRPLKNTELKENINIQLVKEKPTFDKCSIENSIQNTRLVMDFQIGLDGKISHFDVPNIDNNRYSNCIEKVVTENFKLSNKLISFPVKVRQEIIL